MRRTFRGNQVILTTCRVENFDLDVRTLHGLVQYRVRGDSGSFWWSPEYAIQVFRRQHLGAQY